MRSPRAGTSDAPDHLEVLTTSGAVVMPRAATARRRPKSTPAPSGAIRASFPGFIPPCLATPGTRVPARSQWIHEIKMHRLDVMLWTYPCALAGSGFHTRAHVHRKGIFIRETVRQM